jgi:uncharacterized protein (TIGR02145 family)
VYPSTINRNRSVSLGIKNICLSVCFFMSRSTSWHKKVSCCNNDWKLTPEAFSWYNNDSVSNAFSYGGLYNWYVISSNKLCPSGWHVATDKDFGILDTLLGAGTVAGGKMKETGTTHWKAPNTGADNSSGFTALPGGSRDVNGSFSGITEIGHYWTGTEYNTSNAWLWYVYFSNITIARYNNDKHSRYSVRCVKN